MLTNHFESLQSAYWCLMKELDSNGEYVASVSDPTSVGSMFGNKVRDFFEVKGVSFVLRNPKNRLIASKVRKISFGFSIANFIWLLSGENTVDRILPYNNKGAVFSSNGLYYEAAFGDRIFGTYKLWEHAKSILNLDPTTRRAEIPLFFQTDLINRHKDTPCADNIQLMIRNGRLDFFLNMRSQSAYSVFPYDLFLFTMLHEFFSLEMNLPLGNFYYYCKSFHYYLEEQDKVKSLLLEAPMKPNEMPSMCKTDQAMIKLLLENEERIRFGLYNTSNDAVTYNMPDYWLQLLNFLPLKLQQEKGAGRIEQNEVFYHSNKLHL